MGEDGEWPRPVSRQELMRRGIPGYCWDSGEPPPEELPGPLPPSRTYRNPEQNEILGTFYDRLAVPTGDGGVKRAAGTKPHWKVDTSHKLKMLGHLARWLCGERVDKDSGAHPLDHVAWRALAIAHQETAERQEGDPDA